MNARLPVRSALAITALAAATGSLVLLFDSSRPAVAIEPSPASPELTPLSTGETAPTEGGVPPPRRFEADTGELASLRAELEEYRALARAVEADNQGLQERIAYLEDLLRHPEDDPVGSFLRMPEWEQLGDEQRRFIKALLEHEYPVVLLPGEPTWLAERDRLDDWLNYGESFTEAVVLYFGPERLERELPPAPLKDLHDSYPELFGRD